MRAFCTRSTVNASEVNKFSGLAKDWWNPKGTSSMLHLMNPVRIAYIRQSLSKHGLELSNSSVLDVGCGGGLLSESLARCGANVVGIDASEEAINVARAHGKQDLMISEKGNLQYINTTAEGLEDNQEFSKTDLFDCVTALEIVEHVEDPAYFIESCVQYLRPGGFLFMSTINRTQLAYLLTILIAESPILGIPKGTHDWNKYVTPQELVGHIRASGLCVHDVSGIVFNPLTWNWSMYPSNTECNYILCAQKPAGQ